MRKRETAVSGQSRVRTAVTVIASICVVAWGLSSCTAQQNNAATQRDAIDSLLISRVDSLYTHPAEMAQRFHDAQKNVTDSTAYYKLELFAGYCRFLLGDFDRAIEVNQAVLHYCNRHPDAAALEGICWNHRFALLHDMNQKDSAIACLHHAYEAIYRSEDHRELESVCINLADQYRLKGDFADASKYYRKALWVVDSLDSKRVRFSVYVGLGQVYADLQNFRLAHHYYDLAEQDPEPHLEYEEYHYLNSKGNCYYYEERYREALTCFQEAYTVARRFNQPLFDALVEANLGEIYTLLGQYDSAHHYLDKSYAYFESNSTANEEAVFYLNSLQAALALRQNKLALVNHYLSRPFNPLHIGPNYIYLHNKRFMEYYAQKGDFEKAYHYKSIVEKYDDSLRNVRKLNNIAEIDYRYSQDTLLLKRDVLIANNEMRLSQQRNAIILVVSLLVISVLLGILTLVHVRRKNERAYNRQVELVRSLRMENVRNRLSPHYLFNVLNTIMPAFKQYADLSHLLKLFIQVLRDNLQVSEQIAVELQDEIGRVKNYIALRRETNPDKVSTEWHIDKYIPLKTLIPSMGIQIPVENALKYAFDPDSDEERLLTIRISTEGQGIRIVVRDNGCGYDPGKYTGSERSTSNGLRMLFGVTEVLNTKNTEKMTFDIRNIALTEPSEHGTQVTLFVPYHYQFKL